MTLGHILLQWSLSYHSHQRPPSLMWPNICVTTANECIYFSLSPKATYPMWPQFLRMAVFMLLDGNCTVYYYIDLYFRQKLSSDQVDIIGMCIYIGTSQKVFQISWYPWYLGVYKGKGNDSCKQDTLQRRYMYLKFLLTVFSFTCT